MKMALQYWINRGERGRTKFIAFKGGYHGDTTGAMAVTDPDSGMHDIFRGLLPEHVIADLPTDAASADALELVLARHAENIAGLIVEPLVQGAGGMRFHDAATLQASSRDRRPVRRAADLRRNLHRLRPHRHDVRLRAGGRRARHRHAVEGADRRHAAAGRDGRAQARVRGVLVGRSGEGADARPDLHGQCARLRRRQCVARSVRARAAAAAGGGDRRVRWRTSWRLAAICRASRTCGCMGAIGVVEMERIGDLAALRARFVEEGVFIRPFGRIIYLTPSFTIEPQELVAAYGGHREGRAARRCPGGLNERKRIEASDWRNSCWQPWRWPSARARRKRRIFRAGRSR